MAYRVIWTPDAQENVRSILSYINIELCNKKAAADLFNHIVERLHAISAFPKSCELSKNTHLSKQGLRRAVIDNYVLLYLADDTHQCIEVIGVFHGSQDYARLI